MAPSETDMRGQVWLAVILLMGPATGAVLAQGVLSCQMTHPGGVQEGASVSLGPAGEITGFSWVLDKKGRGQCNIQASTFRVVRHDRFVGKGGCELMAWQQGTRLTLALSPATPECRSYCSSQQAYESLLPMSFEGNGCGQGLQQYVHRR